MALRLLGFSRGHRSCLPDSSKRQTRDSARVCLGSSGASRTADAAQSRLIGYASRHHRRALTLIELLVVVSTLSVLIAIIVPSFARARGLAQRAVCLTNLHGIGGAIHIYAGENNGCIPFGPKAPPVMTSTDLYPSTGAPTTLISLRKGKAVGLGLMLSDELSSRPEALFCPGSDQPMDGDAELAKVGREQAQSSYYYRHASITRLFDPPGVKVLSPDHIRLDNLGTNRNSKPIRALAMDSQFLVPSGFAQFGIRPRTHHAEEWANVLYSDGHAATLFNADQRFTVNLDSHEAMKDAFGRILEVLEQADEEQRSTPTEKAG